MNNGAWTLKREREIDGAILDLETGRYYVEIEQGLRAYGYRTRLSGTYVCYTDGHYCECGEGEE